MTLIIRTISHGDIEGGFFSVYTNGFRFGEYAFPTQHIHSVIEYFAKNPKRYAANLFSFGEDIFWDEFSQQISELGLEILTRTDDLGSIIDEFFKEGQGIFDPVKISAMRETMVGVPIRIPDDEEQVALGQYRLDRSEFKGLVYYVVRGGWFGWNNNTPESAERAKIAIQNSTRTLFKGIF